MTELLSFGALRVPEDADLGALAATADAHAVEVWGERVGRGEPFSVCDADGSVDAYVFPYVRGATVFPADPRECADGERFGAVYVDARSRRRAVLRVVGSLPPLFAQASRAELVGRTVLGAGDAAISRAYWLGMHQEYLEVSALNRTILLDMTTLKQVDPEVALRPRPLDTGTPAAAPDEWREEPAVPGAPATTMAPHGDAARVVMDLPAIEPGGLKIGSVLKLVPQPECVPVVDWTYWCVPTSFTMATCYYDNYVKGVGGILGYGRLAGCWQEHLELNNGPAHFTNVPDYIDQLIDPTLNPPTWRQGFSGWDDFMRKTYGYSFRSRDVPANATNDWAWTQITAEIDAGRPFVWGVPDHAVCAFGYRIACDGSKRVICYSTWGSTAEDQYEEWLYTKGKSLTCILPGGATTGNDLVLWSPDGGESLLTHVATTVRWYVWSSQIRTAEVEESSDAGVSWRVVRQAAPCQAGWNSTEWTPTIPSDRCRVRVRGFSETGAYVAGDGSQTNVVVKPGPRSAVLDTVLITSQTDITGRFHAVHGLEHYAPDGYAIRGMTVAVQHKNGTWHPLEHSNDIDNRFWWNGTEVGGSISAPAFHNRPVQVILFAERVVG